MQMNGIYANQANNQMAVKQQKSNLGYEKGQVIEGVISKVSDEVSINFSGREFTFSKNTVQNAKEGEIRQFEIVDLSKGGIVLKEVGSKAGGNGNASNTSCTMVNVDSYGFIERKDDKEKTKEESEEDLSDTSNKMTNEDYEELSKEGFTLEKFNQERLSRALDRIKEQKSLKQKGIENQTEQMEKLRESVEASVRGMVSDTTAANMIANKLVELDLPVTKENVERMLSTMNLAKEAGKISDASSAYLIRNELEPTAQNIYKAVHSGSKENLDSKEEAWEELVDVVTNVITEAGLPVDENNLTTARWLIDRDLPITGENIKYKKFLDKMKEGDFVNFALQSEALMICNGSNIGNALVYEDNSEAASRIVGNVNKITEDGLLLAFYKKQTKAESLDLTEEGAAKLTLKELNEAQDEILQNPNASSNLDVNKDSIQYITAKRQLEEIRLKMTTESCNKMLIKGFQVETENLSQVVDELKTIEDSYYKNLLKEVGAGEEHLSLLKETSESLKSLQEAPSAILGSTYTSRNLQTIQSLTEIGNTYTERFKNAGESYEALMTKPRSDLGDSIVKAFEHVDEMLEQLNLDPTNANRRAVRILGYNSIEINEENIQAMKVYDAKVNELFTNLNPPVTATLIKEGINPLQMSIDEINELAKSIQERDGGSREESFSEYLIRLEDNKELTKDERKSYIGIYRLLNQIDKSDGAAIGALVKAGQEVTLNNLLTAVRTKNRGTVDTSINDDFGSLVSLAKAEESITEQINAAYNSQNSSSMVESDETWYQKNILSQLLKEISPDKVDESVKIFGENLGDISLERLKEEFDLVKTDATNDPVIRNRMEQLQTVSNNTELEQQFLKEYEISSSINNLIAAKEMGENPASLYQNINELTKSLKNKSTDTNASENGEGKYPSLGDIRHFTDSIDDPEKLTSMFDHLKTETENLLGKALEEDNLNIADLQLMNSIRSALPLTLSLSKKEYFNIPMETSDGIMAMNLTVVHESEDKGRVTIKIPNETYGTVSAELSIDNKQLKCFITAENKGVVNELKNQEDELSNHLKDLGFNIEELYYVSSPVSNNKFIFKNGSIYKATNESESAINSTNNTSTNELYLAAKAVVEHIQNWSGSKKNPEERIR